MHRRPPFLLVLALSLAAALVVPTVASAAPPPKDAYIVVLKDGADSRSVADDHRKRHGAKVSHVYRHALNGYAARISGTELAAVRSDRRVDYVEKDGEARASATTQSNATWGLDRIDARLGLDGSFTYDATGTGVTAYIIDTGIQFSHSEFGGRAVSGYDAIDGGTADDCDGHGTHVAGTVGGASYGVAKAVNLVAVRVLDCNGSGTWSGVIAGVDWVTANAAKPAVANMSLGGGASDSVDTAVRNSIAAGTGYAIAAGNGNMGGKEQDACNYSPARVADAMTIGATTKSDAKTSWSNYGNCVDWFAPGYQITSAWIGSDSATSTISGTSMAAPHVAGVAATYLQSSPGASPNQVRDALYGLTTKGIVTSSKTANNHLLYSVLGTGSGGTLTNAPPTASFTYTCTDLGCSFDGSASTDSDGTVSGHSWEFGDGKTATGATASHAYAAGGTYTVKLTVTDDDGATSTTSQSVTVSSSTTDGGFSLTASGYKVKGVQHADLAWDGATSPSVDVYRNGGKVATTNNDKAHTDNIGHKGGGSYTYKVCEAGTTTCSNEFTVTFS